MGLKPLSTNAIADFCENMAFLVCVGLPLATAASSLQQLANTTKDKSTKGLSMAASLVLPALQNGESLGTALLLHRDRFGTIGGQVEAAEQAGKLVEALRRIAKEQRSRASLLKRVRSALVQPVVMLILILIISLYLFVAVLPDMMTSLSVMGTVELPTITLVMMGISDFLVRHWAVLLVATVLACLGLRYLMAHPLKRSMHQLYAKLPIVGNVICCHSLLSFYETLSYMIFANQPLDKALLTAAQDVPNLYIQSQTMEAAEFYRGSRAEFQEVLSHIHVIPLLEQITLTTGYQADEFVSVLDSLVVNKRNQFNATLDGAIQWIVPITTIFIAFLAGMVAIAVYTPILNMGTVI